MQRTQRFPCFSLCPLRLCDLCVNNTLLASAMTRCVGTFVWRGISGFRLKTYRNGGVFSKNTNGVIEPLIHTKDGLLVHQQEFHRLEYYFLPWLISALQ